MINAPEEERATEEATKLYELNPSVINCEPQIAPVEELKNFPIDTQDQGWKDLPT